MPEERLHNVGLAGLLHDYGKALIPNEILTAPRSLTFQEFEVMTRAAKFRGGNFYHRGTSGDIAGGMVVGPGHKTLAPGLGNKCTNIVFFFHSGCGFRGQALHNLAKRVILHVIARPVELKN